MKSGATDPFADDQQDDQDEATTEADGSDSNTGQSDSAVSLEGRQEEDSSTGQSDSSVELENRQQEDSSTGQSDSSVELENRQQEDSNTGQSDSAVIRDGDQQEDSRTSQFNRSDLPRIVTRDTVKEDRDAVHQLFVYEDTAEKEKEARRALEDRIGDIYKLDAREAIYRAGMENLDDAEAILRKWGADI